MDHDVLWPVFVVDRHRDTVDTSAWLGAILEVEQTLAAAQADLEIVPRAASDAVASLRAEDFDVELLARRTAAVGFPILGVVEQIADRLPDGLGQYAHWGATTQDILDSAQSILLTRAYDRLADDLSAIGSRLVELAELHRGTLMTARSQSQPALPTTFGLRAAGWLSGIVRHLARLDESRPRVLVLQLSGAVGTGAAFGEHATVLHRMVAERLGLHSAPVNWHTQRDGLAEAASVFAGAATSLGKLGLDVALSAQPEIGELREGSEPGSGASSTMPQKRNPILAQQLVQNARLARGLVPTVLEAGLSDHDRGTGVWPIEWVALPQLSALTLGAAAKARSLVDRLEIDATRMAENLAANDRVMAEAVMMRLAEREGRQRAHDLVAEALRKQPNGPIAAALGAAGIDLAAHASAPDRYLGSADEQIDAAIAAFERCPGRRR